MKFIELKSEATILLVKEPILPTEEEVSFSVPFSEEVKAKVNISFTDKIIDVEIKKYPITDALLEYLQEIKQFNLNELDSDYIDEISDMSSTLSSVATLVLATIKYHLSYIDISEQLFSIKSRRWRFESNDWKPIPTSISTAFSGRAIQGFNDRICQKIQESLNEKITPLIGMRHLHRAINEPIPHHKWIDATIAAELAVKEILIRAKPELETLLMEVPSPPLYKLYGSILEKYLGERSPYLNKIQEGIEIRNKLVHRPSAEWIDHQKAINYVIDIEKAINHLLSLLYPNNKLFKSY